MGETGMPGPSVFEFNGKDRMCGPDELLFAEDDPAFYVYKLVSGVVICQGAEA
jgi:hypothetical protein